MEALRAWYSNPLEPGVPDPQELAPVGLVMAFFSAALLRNPRLLPARLLREDGRR